MNDKKEKKFILTTNEETAALLIKGGFKIANQTGKQWFFVNDGRLLFNNLNDVIYTNRLTF